MNRTTYTDRVARRIEITTWTILSIAAIGAIYLLATDRIVSGSLTAGLTALIVWAICEVRKPIGRPPY